MGTGVKVVSTQAFTRGGLVSTDNSLDLQLMDQAFSGTTADGRVGYLELEFCPEMQKVCLQLPVDTWFNHK